MSDSKQELSSFIDGQDSSNKLLDKLVESATLKEEFARYHLIGEAMRDELPSEFSLDFSDKVAAAIALEPTVIAPKKRAVVKNSQTKFKTKSADVIPFFGRIGQYGIAASVAAVLVLGVQQYGDSDQKSKAFPVLQTIPTGGFASPVSLQAPSSNELQQQIEQSQRMQQQRRLNAYVNDHILQQRLKSQVKEVVEQQ